MAKDPPPLTADPVVVSPLPLELLLTDSLSDSPESGGVRASSPADAVGDSGWARGACCKETKQKHKLVKTNYGNMYFRPQLVTNQITMKKKIHKKWEKSRITFWKTIQAHG